MLHVPAVELEGQTEAPQVKIALDVEIEPDDATCTEEVLSSVARWD
jgi:hypothetical protein